LAPSLASDSQHFPSLVGPFCPLTHRRPCSECIFAPIFRSMLFLRILFPFLGLPQRVRIPGRCFFSFLILFLLVCRLASGYAYLWGLQSLGPSPIVLIPPAQQMPKILPKMNHPSLLLILVLPFSRTRYAFISRLARLPPQGYGRHSPPRASHLKAIPQDPDNRLFTQLFPAQVTTVYDSVTRRGIPRSFRADVLYGLPSQLPLRLVFFFDVTCSLFPIGSLQA